MKDLTNREFKQITSSNSQKFEGKLAIGGRTSQLQSAPKLPLETATIRGKEQRTRSSANWEEQYLKTPRAPSNSPSGTSNSPLLFSNRRDTDQAEEWILRGRGFAVNGIGGNSGRPLCPAFLPPLPLWKPGEEARRGGRRRRPWHFICRLRSPPLLTPRGLQNRILSAQQRANPSRRSPGGLPGSSQLVTLP